MRIIRACRDLHIAPVAVYSEGQTPAHSTSDSLTKRSASVQRHPIKVI